MLVTYAESRGFTAASTSVVIARSYSRYSRSTSLRQRHDRVGVLLGEDRAHPLLVVGVGVGVQEADAEGVDALRRGTSGPPRGRRPRRTGRTSAPVKSSRPPTPLTRSRGTIRSRLHPEVGVAVAVGHRLPGDLEHRLVALGGDEAEPVDLALEQLVGGDRGAVADRAIDVAAPVGGRAGRAPCRCRPGSRRPGCAGVDGVLVVTSSPVSSSKATTSVNVPPVSMPIRMRRGAGCSALMPTIQAVRPRARRRHILPTEGRIRCHHLPAVPACGFPRLTGSSDACVGGLSVPG